MFLTYPNKKTAEEILNNTKAAELLMDQHSPTRNQLIHGDNLRVMKTLLNENLQVDLIYIDPPFARNTTFRSGNDRTATISPSRSDDIAYHDKRVGEDYIEFLRERLIFLRELLAPTGSVYVHIDDKIGHYVKVIMDEVFGRSNFRNDIARIKTNPKNFGRKGYGNIKDMILFYTKSPDAVWNEPKTPASREAIQRLFNKVDKHGRPYTTNPLHAPGETKDGESGKPWNGIKPPRGRHWRYSRAVLDQLEQDGLIEWSSTGNPRKIIFADDHANHRLQDIWDFKDSQRPTYPTEKNIDLLRTIIQASSEPGQIVMDAFCGSGTTMLAAEALNRCWIGIDESDVAVQTALKRFSTLANTLFQTTPSFRFRRQLNESALPRTMLQAPRTRALPPVIKLAA
jgi:adenine-specific DNA-methyltransferase